MRKLIFILAFVLLIPAAAWAQGTGFNFQGRLNDGANPANGSYDLQFSLINQITGGTQIGSTIARPNTALINGVFSVTLDFGSTAFNNPNAVFIEIGVKPAGSPNAFTILGPRQQLTVVPFAVRAANATNADSALVARFADFAGSAEVAGQAQNANTLNDLRSTDFIRNSTTVQPTSNFNISGSGVIVGTLNVGGNTNIGGNGGQSRDKSGFVKAMVYVDQNGVIVRCFNGITGTLTGSCGFTVSRQTGNPSGAYLIDFGFQVNDRFIAVTPGAGAQVTLNASFIFRSAGVVEVHTNITDVDHFPSFTDDDFMIIVF